MDMDQYEFFKDGQYGRHREFEVHLTTYDGSQHLRLNGWLKRNDVIVKSESIDNTSSNFGSFIIFINDIVLEKLKEDNLERGLFLDIEVFNSEGNRWNAYKGLDDSTESAFRKIKDFLFNFQIQDKKDIDKFLKQANETSLALFKKNDDFVNDYIKTKELSVKEKLRDLELMIESFIEEERYEDCAFLVKIKTKIEKHHAEKITKNLLKNIKK